LAKVRFLVGSHNLSALIWATVGITDGQKQEDDVESNLMFAVAI
jgi:hypothetical protein